MDVRRILDALDRIEDNLDAMTAKLQSVRTEDRFAKGFETALAAKR